MNIVDIICLIFLGYAAFRGVKNGLLIELGSIIALLIGVWLSFHYGERFGTWLGFVDTTALVVGFILLLIAVVLFIIVSCYALRAVLNFAGLGLFDTLGGALVSIFKTALILSLLLGFMVPFNAKKKWMKPERFENSFCTKMLLPVSPAVFPYIKQAKDAYVHSLKVAQK